MSEQLISEFRRSLDPNARLAAPSDPAPKHWQAYLESDASRAQTAFRQEMSSIAPYLPETSAALDSCVIDGCLVVSSTYGLCRLISLQVEETVHVAWSRAPTRWAAANRTSAWAPLDAAAPEQYSWIMRNAMDGLTDLYGFGGPLNSGLLTTLESQIDTFGETEWFDEIASRHNPADLVLTFSSGGGAYLVFDVSGRLGSGAEARALLLDVKTTERPAEVPFLSYLDAWTAIGLAG